MAPIRTLIHIRKLIDGNVKDEEKIKIIKKYFDWDIEDGFMDELTDGEMLDMIYDMTFKGETL
jgi:hypothetical protein